MPCARGAYQGARRLIRAGEGTPVVGRREGAAGCTKERSPSVLEAAGPTDVELDLDTGVRAHRGCTAPAAGREIVISRGEMVEIGDGFRLPDLLVSTGPGCAR